MQQVKTAIDPTVVLLPTRADDTLLQALDPHGVIRNPEGSSQSHYFGFTASY